MRLFVFAAAALLAAVPPAVAEGPTPVDPLRTGMEGALRGCETWILDPQSWIDDPAPFLAAIDLSGRVSEAEALPEALLPPEPLRRGNRYWRIGAGGETGYALVVSVDLPMCHVTGGGGEDLQPAAEAVVGSASFTANWSRVEEERSTGIVSTLFRSRKEPKLTLLVSRADAPDARRDRPQVVATAIYDLGR
ncbi:hypothetical protein [Aureimonas pseudogalii]|uniref:Uncharacterized protein n=1 Tax=Aureimonas pseudogalii TaxID=1744844 RepID=A0A7W6H7W2_9HYPH|nr:hypothetical protein [Aureimonas pseudogalii]MBB4000201.1 hypothetical protein [Aureimonas pseudogalii]